MGCTLLVKTMGSGLRLRAGRREMNILSNEVKKLRTSPHTSFEVSVEVVRGDSARRLRVAVQGVWGESASWMRVTLWVVQGEIPGKYRSHPQ